MNRVPFCNEIFEKYPINGKLDPLKLDKINSFEITAYKISVNEKKCKIYDINYNLYESKPLTS